jgi:GDPmannose 4,6-dehydratase
VKRALITGISGQDGAYLAKHLLGLGYEVWGTSLYAQISPFHNLHRLGINDHVRLESLAVNDFRSVLQVLATIRPDEVYNLGGQTSVSLSFQQPVETLESISVSTLNFLECIRFMGQPIRFYNAGSSECFGDRKGDDAANELTPFRPWREFVEVAFKLLGLDPRRYVKVDNSLFRPTDIQISRGDATKASNILNWQAKTKMPEVAR